MPPLVCNAGIVLADIVDGFYTSYKVSTQRHQYLELRMNKDTKTALTEFLFLSDPPEPVDLCVVLGAPSPSSIDPAILLFNAGQVSRILITGFGPASQLDNSEHTPEYKVMARIAINSGIPESVLEFETKATNTLENFTFTRAAIEETIGWENIETVAICAKPLHMRRALMTAKTCFPKKLKYVLQPATSPNDIQADTWYKTERGRKHVLNELASIAKYAERGDIDV